MTYSYNPEKLGVKSLDRMRFELGDTDVTEPAKSAYLCDEEILAVIESSKTWTRAKFRLVESVLRRFSYEVDTEVGDRVSWKLHQRIEPWERLYNKLKGEVEAEELADSNVFKSHNQRPPIFRIGMHDWRRGGCI